MSAILSLLRSRLLRPVFFALGIALLVQILVAVALTRSTVEVLEADLGSRLEGDMQRLGVELKQAGGELSAGLESLSASTRERFTNFARGLTFVSRSFNSHPLFVQQHLASPIYFLSLRRVA